jgi:hypothetical protein
MKITNKRELAIKIGNNEKIELSSISKKLNRIVELWISYKEIKIENNYLVKC